MMLRRKTREANNWQRTNTLLYIGTLYSLVLSLFYFFFSLLKIRILAYTLALVRCCWQRTIRQVTTVTCRLLDFFLFIVFFCSFLFSIRRRAMNNDDRFCLFRCHEIDKKFEVERERERERERRSKKNRRKTMNSTVIWKMNHSKAEWFRFEYWSSSWQLKNEFLSALPVIVCSFFHFFFEQSIQIQCPGEEKKRRGKINGNGVYTAT